MAWARRVAWIFSSWDVASFARRENVLIAFFRPGRAEDFAERKVRPYLRSGFREGIGGIGSDYRNRKLTQ